MIHVPESKLHSLPTTSPPFLLTRPSTTRHSPNLTNQVVLPFSNETSSRIFLASNHPTKPRTPGLPSPSKALASFNKAFKDKYSPSNRTIMTPNRNSGIIDDENTNLPLKMSLQEVKDDQGNCHVRFIRKPEKNGFRALLNRYKQENEAYPSILQSRTFEGEAVDFKLNSGRHTPTARSIIAKMLRKREDKGHENVKETSAEAAYNQAIKEAITNALPRRAPVMSHNRAKSVQIDVQSPVKQQNLPSASFSRPKTPAKIRVVLPTRQTRAQTATADDIKNMIEVSGLLQADRKLDSEQNEKRQYYLNKVPLLKELSGVEAESHLHNRYAKRPRNKGKLHPFAMSLSYTQSPIGSIKDKLSSSGFEKWSVVGSSKQIEQTRTSMDRQKKERTTITNGFMNLGAIKDWLDVLTVKGNVVTPSQPQDVVLENSQGPQAPTENREAHLTQKSLCSSRKQRAEDKVKNQPEIKITRFSMTPKPRREDIKKEVKSVVLAQRKKSADIVEKVIKGVVVLPKKLSFSMEKDAKEKGEKKEKDAWQDNLSGVGLDGWEVSPTHENFDKICLDERIDTVQSKNDDVQTEEL